MHPIYRNAITENHHSHINRIFQVASAIVNIVNESKLFKFELASRDNIDSFSYETKDVFYYIQMKYKIKWPLYLPLSLKNTSKA